MADVPAGPDVVGSPAQPVRHFSAKSPVLRRLDREADREGGRHGAAGGRRQVRTERHGLGT